MEINSAPGTKVIFDKNPYENDSCKGLVKGESYTVERTEVHGFHTDVHLKEFPGRHFNSCVFEQEK